MPIPSDQKNPHASTTRTAPLLSGRRLVRRYGDAVALAGVDVDIHAGQMLAVMGPSGSGKTTLLHLLAGVDQPDDGQVFLDDSRVDTRSEKRRSQLRRTAYGFVFQSGMLIAELTAIENAALPLLLGGVDRRTAVSAAASWFGPLGLSGLEQRRPGQLSGGQQQRVAVARALAHRPRIVFADEPTAALDSHTGQTLLDHLTAISRSQQTAIVVVTHDPQVATRADRVLTLRDGRVVTGLGAEVGR